MAKGCCGHELKEKEGNRINVKDYVANGKRAVSTIVVCDECLKFYQKNNMILSTPEEQGWWFSGVLKD